MPPQETGGGEWSQVKRKNHRLRTLPLPTPNQNEAADSLTDGLRPNPRPELSVDDLWRYHQAVTTDWQTTEWWAQVRKVVEAALSGEKRAAVTTAVCLGPGPFEPANGSGKARRTAHLQVAGFCFLVEQLSRSLVENMHICGLLTGCRSQNWPRHKMRGPRTKVYTDGQGLLREAGSGGRREPGGVQHGG